MIQSVLVLNFISYHFLPHSLLSSHHDLLVPRMHQLAPTLEQFQLMCPLHAIITIALGLVHS